MCEDDRLSEEVTEPRERLGLAQCTVSLRTESQTQVHVCKPLKVESLCGLPGPLKAKHTDLQGGWRSMIKSFLFSVEREGAAHLARAHQIIRSGLGKESNWLG